MFHLLTYVHKTGHIFQLIYILSTVWCDMYMIVLCFFVIKYRPDRFTHTIQETHLLCSGDNSRDVKVNAVWKTLNEMWANVSYKSYRNSNNNRTNFDHLKLKPKDVSVNFTRYSVCIK